MAPVMNWTGFYIGVNGGYSWGRSTRDLNFFNPLNGVIIASGTGGGRDLDGGVFGGQIGYNWQTANWVFGIETDAQWTGQKGSTTVLCPVAGCFPAAIAQAAHARRQPSVISLSGSEPSVAVAVSWLRRASFCM